MRRILVLSAVGLMALAGCGAPEQPEATQKDRVVDDSKSGGKGTPGASKTPQDPKSEPPTSPKGKVTKPPRTSPGRSLAPGAGKGRLVAFEKYDNKGGERKLRPAEVSQPDQTEAFLKPIGQRRSAKIDGARKQGVRLFAFPLVGCRLTGAELHISSNDLEATPAGDDKVRCMMAEYYYAVFAVDADDVPPKARIGPLLR